MGENRLVPEVIRPSLNMFPFPEVSLRFNQPGLAKVKISYWFVKVINLNEPGRDLLNTRHALMTLIQLFRRCVDYIGLLR